MNATRTLLVALACAAGASACESVAGSTTPTGEPRPEPATTARTTFDALAAGLSLAGDATTDALRLALPDRAEDTYGTIGTLALGLHPSVVPIVATPHGTLVAASTLGAGRVVAFAGQDFLSSGTRSTLLSAPGVARLLGNAVRWVGRGAGKVLVDNEAVRAALAAEGVTGLEVVESDGEVRRWSTDLAPYAAVVVQVNEWGTARVAPADVAHLAAFVRGGGGLLVAGSALHWSWWLTGVSPDFAGDALLGDGGPDGAGITWNTDAFLDVAGASLRFDALSAPLALWQAYVRGDDVGEAGERALPSVFASAEAQGLDVDPALARLVREAPALPVAASLARARLSAGVLAALGPHRWPTPHPWAAVFPGAVAAEVPRVAGFRATIDLHWVGPVPLGVYAPPGEVVTIAVPEGGEALGLAVQVGERHDALDAIGEVTTWQRAPGTWRTTPLDARVVRVGTGLGGTLYVDLPDGERTGTLEVTVDGAVRQPLWIAGETTDWTAELAHVAPQGILERPGKVRLAVARSELRADDDPAAILRYWEGFYDSHFALSHEPVPRRRASHFIFDPQVGWGYANTTPERIDFPALSTAWALRRDLEHADDWLFGHELGHQFQTSNWTGGDVTEVCVNLFTMNTLNTYIHHGGDRETLGHLQGPLDEGACEALRWPTADLFQKLDLYRQLIAAFGWRKLGLVFASYYDPAFTAADDGESLDGFAIRMSEIAQRDLTAFFDHWQYPLSATAHARIASFGYPRWWPPGWAPR